MDALPVDQVAQRLGVSNVQVRRLIAAGDIKASLFGRNWAIDPASVRRYAALRPAAGRPLAAKAAWARLRNAQISSIAQAEAIAADARRRGERHAAWIAPGALPAILADHRLVLSGVAAAAAHGAPVDERPPHLAYARRSDLAQLADRYHLDPDHHDPNLILRIIADDVWPFAPGQHHAPANIAVVDLVAELDHRSALELIRNAP